MGNTGFKVSSVFFILSLLSDKTFQTINNLLIYIKGTKKAISKAYLRQPSVKSM